MQTIPLPPQQGLSALRVPALDGLRGVAIVLVLLHMFQVAQPTGVGGGILDTAFQTLMGVGWIGVQLFFVLSGYLITGQLLDSQGSPNYFSGFFGRRVLRIFPLYYGMLILAFVIRPLFLDGPSALEETAHNQFWLWTFLYNWVHPFGHYIAGFTHFWSLAVEEQFYLFWPLLVWRRTPRQMLYICIGVLFAALTVRVFMRLQGVTPVAVYVFTVCRMDALAAGAAVAAIMRLPSTGGAGGRALAASLVCLIAGCAVLPWFDQNTLLVQTLGMSFLSIGFAGLVYWLRDPASGPRLLTAALELPLLRTLGKYSYGMYVFHLPLHYFVLTRLIPWMSWGRSAGLLPLIYFLLASAVTLLLAMLSYQLYEKRFLSFKHRFAAQQRPAAAAASGGTVSG